MLCSLWLSYVHSGHLMFSLAMLCSLWLSYVHSGYLMFILVILCSRWLCYVHSYVLCELCLLFTWLSYVHSGSPEVFSVQVSENPYKYLRRWFHITHLCPLAGSPLGHVRQDSFRISHFGFFFTPSTKNNSLTGFLFIRMLLRAACCPSTDHHF